MITVSNRNDEDAEESTASPDGASDESSGDASVTFDDNGDDTTEQQESTTESTSDDDETTESTQPAEPEPTELQITFEPNVETFNVEPDSAFEITCRVRGPFSNLQAMFYKDQVSRYAKSN